MKPLFVLLTVFALSLLVISFLNINFDIKLAGKIAISAMLIFTALGHFKFTKGMALMIPDFLPARTALVYFTGVLEIAFALSVFVPKISEIAGIFLIIFLIVIFPANVFASIKHLNYETATYDGKGVSYLWFRIPFQILLIFWVYYFVLK